MSTDFTSKNIEKLDCELCDFKCCKKGDYNRHVLTSKHKKLAKINNLSTHITQNTSNIEIFVCNNCNKQYKERSGLWRHKQKCEQSQSQPQPLPLPLCESLNDIVNPEFIITLLKQNNELQQQILELCKNGINNNSVNTINSHNKTFNLQVFLNEQCKDAINIMEFVDTIKLDLSDAESVRKLGYVNGISNIIIKHLKALDVHMRPVHCTDLKRETVYVKYQDVWEKEGDDNKLMRKAIKHVAVKNYNAADIFKELHPDCMNWDSKHGDHFALLRIEALGGKGNVNIYDSHTKIIKKIAKEITIDKNA